eukprot:IDg5679t1
MPRSKSATTRKKSAGIVALAAQPDRKLWDKPTFIQVGQLTHLELLKETPLCSKDKSQIRVLLEPRRINGPELYVTVAIVWHIYPNLQYRSKQLSNGNVFELDRAYRDEQDRVGNTSMLGGAQSLIESIPAMVDNSRQSRPSLAPGRKDAAPGTAEQLPKPDPNSRNA